MKEFGPTEDEQAPERDEFAFTYRRESQPGVLFKVVLGYHREVNTLDVNRVMRAVKSEDPGVIDEMITFVAKMLDDTDGVTPARWSAEELPRKEGSEHEAGYRAPDGEIYPFSDEHGLAYWTGELQASSRRKWRMIFDPKDDDINVRSKDLSAVVEFLTGEAADRPTRRRA